MLFNLCTANMLNLNSSASAGWCEEDQWSALVLRFIHHIPKHFKEAHIQPSSHTFTFQWAAAAMQRCCKAHWEKIRLQCLAQGHFDSGLIELRFQTATLQSLYNRLYRLSYSYVASIVFQLQRIKNWFHKILGDQLIDESVVCPSFVNR